MYIYNDPKQASISTALGLDTPSSDSTSMVATHSSDSEKMSVFSSSFSSSEAMTGLVRSFAMSMSSDRRGASIGDNIHMITGSSGSAEGSTQMNVLTEDFSRAKIASIGTTISSDFGIGMGSSPFPIVAGGGAGAGVGGGSKLMSLLIRGQRQCQ